MMSDYIGLILYLITAVGTYFVLMYRVGRLEKDFTKHAEKDDKQHESEKTDNSKSYNEINNRLDACFKRVDSIDSRATILERDTSTHLTMPKAEEKFVSKGELDLHLKNIELKTDQIDKAVTAMSGKQDELIRLLSTNVVKTLSGKYCE